MFVYVWPSLFLPEKLYPQKAYGLHRIYILYNAYNIMPFKAYNEFSEKNVDKAIADEHIFFLKKPRLLEKSNWIILRNSMANQ